MNRFVSVASLFVLSSSLLVAGCSHTPLKTPSQDEMQSLFQATGQNRINDVNVLLKQGVPVNSVNPLGVSPLMLASFKGLDQMVAFLLSQGADPNLGDNRKTTPLHYAAQRGNASTLKLLLEGGGHVAHVDADGLTPLHLSVRFGSLSSTALLLEKGSDPNIKDALGTPVLFFAVARGDKEQVRLLLEEGAMSGTPDADDLTPLTRSIETENRQVFNELFKNLLKEPPDERGPLSDIEGNTSLHYAAVTVDPFYLEALLQVRSEWPLDFNFQNKAGETPAMWAASKRKREHLKLLLNQKINVELVDKKGWDLREHLLSKDFSESEVDELFSAVDKK